MTRQVAIVNLSNWQYEPIEVRTKDGHKFFVKLDPGRYTILGLSPNSAFDVNLAAATTIYEQEDGSVKKFRPEPYYLNGKQYTPKVKVVMETGHGVTRGEIPIDEFMKRYKEEQANK